MNFAVVHVASGREWRGGQRQVWLLARRLEQLGLNQVVVTGAGSDLARRLVTSGVRVRGATWRAGLDPRVLRPILQELRDSPALLHAHDSHALTLAAICSRLTRAPLIATRRVDFHVGRRSLWRRADHIIAISHAVASILTGDGIPPRQVTVVHSGISLEDIRAATPLGIRARLGVDAGTRIASNVAALVDHKDHATLIGAAKALEARLPDLHWVIAGEGEQQPALERQISSLGLGDRVHLLGRIDQPERLIADSNVFVMSSKQEGLGTSVLDAMALGIPVASTAAGGLPELLGSGAGLVVQPQDPEALAGAVAGILTDTVVCQKLVERASAVVMKFSDERMAEQVASVYRSCAHSLGGS